jgi:hypothetical protein
MLIENFNQIIDHWIKEIAQYNFIELCTKPSPNSWSLEQMGQHLIDDTNFYIEQIKICVSSNDHASEDALPMGKTMLHNNDFPNEVLQGAPSNDLIPQPESKERLLNDLMNLRAEMNNVAAVIAASPFNGKTKHPGFNYFSASEWLQFAEMHFRHHLRQRKRIDAFLKANNHGHNNA